MPPLFVACPSMLSSVYFSSVCTVQCMRCVALLRGERRPRPCDSSKFPVCTLRCHSFSLGTVDKCRKIVIFENINILQAVFTATDEALFGVTFGRLDHLSAPGDSAFACIFSGDVRHVSSVSIIACTDVCADSKNFT